MLQNKNWPRPVVMSRMFHLRIPTCIVLALLFALLIFPQGVLAHNTTVQVVSISADGPALNANVGFDSRFRDGNWVPVQVNLSNSGPDFTGTLSVNVPVQYNGSPNPATAATYQTPISLPTGSQKQVTVYAPFAFGIEGSTQNVTINLLDNNGHKVSAQTSALRALNSSDIFVGVLSDQSTGFGPLSGVALPSKSSSVVIQPLNASTMPSEAAVLKNFNLLVLDNFNTSALNSRQLDALEHWVNQGGSLVVVGGPEWRRAISSLPSDLLPVSINGTGTLAAGTSLLPTGGSEQNKVSSSPQAPVPVSTATVTKGNVILTSDTTPLVVQSHYGQGTVSYLAFDPTLEPVVGWSGAAALWKGLLIRTIGDQILTQAQNQFDPGSSNSNNAIIAMLQVLLPNTFPSIWLILLLLLSYVLVLGPVRLLLVKFLKKRDWSWRIVLATIVVFSLLSYGLALQQQGTAILSDSISIVQLNNGNATSSNAHVTTYMGMFVPSQGDFQIHMPGADLVQLRDSSFQYQPNQQAFSQPTTITPTENTTDVAMHGVNIWTLHSLSSEQNRQLRGGITSHLAMKNGLLEGTVTNTLPYPLSDVYVLIGSQYIGLGHLETGQTQQVHLSVTLPVPNNSQSIASQIAAANGQSGGNGPYYNGQQPQNDFQRHLMLLSSLSGENGGMSTYCVNGSCYQQGYAGPNGTLYGGLRLDHDPLTLPNAPATLIGWASAQAKADVTSNVTINGSHPIGQQEILIQAPLDVTLSGSFNLNSAFVSGQMVDVQGTSMQLLSPGVYTVGAGSVTYEYSVAGTSQLRTNSLTVVEVANLPQMLSSGSSPSMVDANHLQVHLYNWKTRAWDKFSFNQYSLLVKNAQPYVGSGGHILLQFSNSDPSQTIVFNKPQLQLQGTL